MNEIHVELSEGEDLLKRRKKMKSKLVFVTVAAVLVFCGASYARGGQVNGGPMGGYTFSLNAAQEEVEKKFESIGICVLSLHPLNLWLDEPNPDFDVLAVGLQVEGKKVEVLLGYALTPSHPDYNGEIFFGANYLLVVENSTRIGLGILTEFKYDDGFKLPSEYSASIYQISATVGFGLKLAGQLWFYVDTYMYKVYFTHERIYGLPVYELDIPILPRLVWKF